MGYKVLNLKVLASYENGKCIGYSIKVNTKNGYKVFFINDLRSIGSIIKTNL